MGGGPFPRFNDWQKRKCCGTKGELSKCDRIQKKKMWHLAFGSWRSLIMRRQLSGTANVRPLFQNRSPFIASLQLENEQRTTQESFGGATKLHFSLTFPSFSKRECFWLARFGSQCHGWCPVNSGCTGPQNYRQHSRDECVSILNPARSHWLILVNEIAPCSGL